MTNKKIMICDDDEGIIQMLEFVLEDIGAEICTELDSLKVFDRIVAESPDILILDLWMPVMSGDQVLKRIRSSEQTAQLPVIVISASRDGNAIALDAGADDFLPKPFDIDELTSLVCAKLELAC